MIKIIFSEENLKNELNSWQLDEEEIKHYESFITLFFSATRRNPINGNLFLSNLRKSENPIVNTIYQTTDLLIRITRDGDEKYFHDVQLSHFSLSFFRPPDESPNIINPRTIEANKHFVRLNQHLSRNGLIQHNLICTPQEIYILPNQNQIQIPSIQSLFPDELDTEAKSLREFINNAFKYSIVFCAFPTDDAIEDLEKRLQNLSSSQQQENTHNGFFNEEYKNFLRKRPIWFEIDPLAKITNIQNP